MAAQNEPKDERNFDPQELSSAEPASEDQTPMASESPLLNSAPFWNSHQPRELGWDVHPGKARTVFEQPRRSPKDLHAAARQPASSEQKIHLAKLDADTLVQSLLATKVRAVLVVDPAGKITSVNDVLAAMFGYGPEELVGQSIEILIPAESRLLEGKEGFFSTPALRSIELGQNLVGKHKDGTHFPIEVSFRFVSGSAGKLAIVFVTDVAIRMREEAAREERDERLRLAVTGARLGTFDFDPQTRTRVFSDTTREFFGIPPGLAIDDNALRKAVHPKDWDQLQQVMNAAMEHGSDGSYSTEFRTLDRDSGTVRWIAVWGRALFDSSGRATRVLGVARDVTDQKAMVEALRRREQDVRSLLDTTPDAIFRLDSELRYTYVNAPVVRLTGIPKERFTGRTAGELNFRQHLTRSWQEAAMLAFETGNIAVTELTYPSAAGPTEWEERIVPEFSPHGSVDAILVIGRDITERKRLERIAETGREEIRALTASLLTVQEEERRRVSLEIHDQICQQLAGLTIEIGTVASRWTISADDRARLRTIQAHANRASHDARHIAYQLHPSILDDLGIDAAIRSLVKEFTDRSAHILATIDTAGLNGNRIPREIASCIYRVTQESLQNIAKHAQARHVYISLSIKDGTVRLSVSDDGCGFAVEALKGGGGLGLVGMEERARLVGGSLSIDSGKDEGTRIVLTIPWNEI